MRSAFWTAEAARQHMLTRVSQTAQEAQKVGVRARLVIFDYSENPVAGQLKALASDLGMLVSVEALERSLPATQLRDRFRLIEKSKGVHGVFLPGGLTPAHQDCLEAHPGLSTLLLDRPQDGLSPHLLSFLQLAAVHGWNPEGRRAAVVTSAATARLGAALADQLAALKMPVTRIAHPEEMGGALSRSELIWFVHGLPLKLAPLHLSPSAVVVDGGKAFDLAGSLNEPQSRLLACRLRGLCTSNGGFSTLINLNRVHRLLTRALGPRRPRLATPLNRGRGRSAPPGRL